MDGPARAQIRLLADDADDLARKAIVDGKKTLFADHAGRGVLQSGATIRVAVRLFEAEAGNLIAKLTDAVAGVSKEPEAFALIAECLARFDAFLIAEFDEVKGKATAGKARTSMISVENAAKNLFVEAQMRWRRQLEIHRFSFTAPSSRLFLASASAAPPTPVAPKNKGGKPLAAHWDQMWAEIAFQLWNGDLQPTKQADISKAMFAWLIANEIDAGQTAVTDRARAIWQKIEASLLG